MFLFSYFTCTAGTRFVFKEQNIRKVWNISTELNHQTVYVSKNFFYEFHVET